MFGSMSWCEELQNKASDVSWIGDPLSEPASRDSLRLTLFA